MRRRSRRCTDNFPTCWRRGDNRTRCWISWATRPPRADAGGTNDRRGQTMRAWRVGLLTALLCASIGGFIRPAPAELGPRAFVSNEFGGDIAVLDVAADRIVGRVVVGPQGTARPRGLALSPDGK